jgi:hypothetical protein
LSPQDNNSEENDPGPNETYDENDDIRSTEDLMKQCQDEINQEIPAPDPWTRKIIKQK